MDMGMLKSDTKLAKTNCLLYHRWNRREHKFRSDVKYLSDRSSKKQVKLLAKSLFRILLYCYLNLQKICLNITDV